MLTSMRERAPKSSYTASKSGSAIRRVARTSTKVTFSDQLPSSSTPILPPFFSPNMSVSRTDGKTPHNASFQFLLFFFLLAVEVGRALGALPQLPQVMWRYLS